MHSPKHMPGLADEIDKAIAAQRNTPEGNAKALAQLQAEAASNAKTGSPMMGAPVAKPGVAGTAPGGVPIGGGTPFTQNPNQSLASVNPVYQGGGGSAPIPATNSPVQTTQTQRSNAASTSTQAAQLATNIDAQNYQPFASSKESQGLKSEVDTAKQNKENAYAGIFTQPEQERIQAAENQATASYKPAVIQAEEAKAQGLPKDIVEAGQRGGFMNTQYAGAAALLPTQGGNFVGAGGVLDKISSAYDANIAQANANLSAAVEKAKYLTQQAIQTGDDAVLQDARQAYSDAQTEYYNGLALQRQYQVDVTAAQDRQIALQEKMVAQADATVHNLAKANVELTPDEVKAFAKTYNMSEDAFQKLYDVTRGEVQSQVTTDAITQAASLSAYLKTTPAGMPTTINGHTYFGTQGTGDVEINSSGHGVVTQVDQQTGAITQKDLGFIGLPKDGWKTVTGADGNVWSINEQTGVARPVIIPGTNSSSHVSADWSTIMPQGGSDTRGGTVNPECGVFSNDINGIGFGDSLYPNPATGDPGKVSKIDPTIGTEANPLRIGDSVVINAGTFGHVAVVNSITTGPDGKTYLKLSEQNWHGDGKIDHTRVITADGPTVLGFARGTLKPQFVSGPSISGQQLNTGVEGKNGTLVDYGGYKWNVVGNTATPVLGPDGKQLAASPKGLDLTDVMTVKTKISNDPRISGYMSLNTSYQNLQTAYDYAIAQGDDKSKATADQALITTYNKMLDPGSVVREGEYARTEQGQAYIAQAEAYYNHLTQGGAKISDSDRRDMVNVAKKLLESSSGQYQAAADEYSATLSQYGQKPEDFIPGYTQFQQDSEVRRNDSLVPAPGAKLFPAGTDVTAAQQQGYTVKKLADGSYLIWQEGQQTPASPTGLKSTW